MPNNGDMPSFSDGQNTSGQGSGVSASSDSRPMVDWIFSNEEYTKAYHELYQQFLDEVDIQSLINQTEELIAPYVERDPTKFCTYEEFQTGVDTLREFCALRSQSVQGQLDGTIPSTQEGQQEDSSALVDASGLTISNMGSMANGGADSRDGAEASGNDPQEQSDERPSERPSNGFSTDGDFNPQTTRGFSGPGNNSGGLSANNLTGWITLGVCLVVLACGMCMTLCFRRE